MQSSRRSGNFGSVQAITGVLGIGLGLVLVGVPLAAVFLSGPAASEAPVRMGGWWLSLNTIAVAVGIGLLAAVIALPGAWLLRRRGWGWAPLVAIPMLSPAYLASSGFNILRAPATWTGDWLGELSRGGTQWPTLFAGRALAVIGLALWASPMAAFVLAAGLRTLEDETLDAFAVDAGPVRRGIAVLVACRGFVVGAVGLVAVLMLGSAVPLHLAQFKTVALLAWLSLQETGSVLTAARACGPLVVGPAFVGAFAAWLAVREPGPERASMRAKPRESRVGEAAAVAWVLGPGVALPIILFATQLRSWNAFGRFWIEAGPAVAESAGVAASVALLAGVLALVVWRIRRGWMLGVVVFAFVVAALVPGVLVGCAWRLAWPDQWPDSRVLIVLAHCTRFGVVGVLGGLLLRRIDDEATRQLMQLDGVSTFRGWWAAGGIRLVGPWMITMAVAAVFSFNEIEGTVVVQSAGALGLPQRLLNDLHQLRMEAMSAAAIWLVMLGLGVSLMAMGVGRLLNAAPKLRGSAPE